MKQYILALLACIACNSITYGMNKKLFRDNSSPILSPVKSSSDIDFSPVIFGTQSLIDICFHDVLNPATKDLVNILKFTAPFVFAYGAACFIDPVPYNSK